VAENHHSILFCSQTIKLLLIIGSSPDSGKSFPDMEDMEKDCNE
jgi:hypothetical protein